MIVKKSIIMLIMYFNWLSKIQYLNVLLIEGKEKKKFLDLIKIAFC